MHCIDCAFRRQDKAELAMFYCASPKLVELSIYNREAEYDLKGDKLVYSYEENGTFYVEDNFGCVHFQPSKKQETCTCKGFYKPVDCPTHGHKASGL